jgi:hypothetical protein
MICTWFSILPEQPITIPGTVEQLTDQCLLYVRSIARLLSFVHMDFRFPGSCTLDRQSHLSILILDIRKMRRRSKKK